VFSTFNSLPFAWGWPCATGVLRQAAADFRVIEEMGFEPEGAGEHVWLWLTKTFCNTHEITLQLARLSGVGIRDVGYAGMKDRNAVTSQWFSVAVPETREPDWKKLESESLAVGQVTRHSRKLRRGSHRGNRFQLYIRDLRGDPGKLESRLEGVARNGAPNYFGAQRFGRDGGNLEAARRMFLKELRVNNRYKRGIYLSAARSELFNQVLAGRVEAGTWNRNIDGDVMMLNGKRSYFQVEKWDALLEARLSEHDIHPTGPLWGAGNVVGSEARRVEEDILASMSLYTDGLEKYGMKHERRALRMVPAGIEWSIEGGVLNLSFSLQKGEFATSLIREVVDC
jgi:tRNA pseudouridine13 synthase